MKFSTILVAILSTASIVHSLPTTDSSGTEVRVTHDTSVNPAAELASQLEARDGRVILFLILREACLAGITTQHNHRQRPSTRSTLICFSIHMLTLSIRKYVVAHPTSSTKPAQTRLRHGAGTAKVC